MKKIFIIVVIFLCGLIIINPIKTYAFNDSVEIATDVDGTIGYAKIGEKIEFANATVFGIDLGVYTDQFTYIFINGNEIHSTDESWLFTFNSPVPLKVYNGNNQLLFTTKANDKLEISAQGRTFNDWIILLNDNEKYQLEELDKITIDTDLRPAISGRDVLINNIETPYNNDEIKEISNLMAFDAYDGNLTDKITLVEDNYLANKIIPGVWIQTYEVTNSLGYKTTYTLTIQNIDSKSPVISGPGSSNSSYKTVVTHGDILSLYTVSDKDPIDLEFKVINDNYVTNKIGTYTYTLEAKDRSGNKSEHTHTLTVKDDVNPVIVDEHQGKIQISFKDVTHIDKLLLGLSANDEIDGNITNKIKIESNNLKNIVGQYQVKYSVSDKAGNKVSYTRDYEVISTDYPNFYVSTSVIMIEDTNLLSIDQLVDIISIYENIDVESYEILVDEYSNNQNTTGEYKLSIKFTDTNDVDHEVERIVRIFNKSELRDRTLMDNITIFFNSAINSFWFTIISGTVLLGLIVVFVIVKRRKMNNR